jgi:hypothetical protein
MVSLQFSWLLSFINGLNVSNVEINLYRLLTGLEPKNERQLSRLPIPESALTISSKKPLTPYQKLIRLIYRSSQGDNLAGLRNEGGRCIVNLVRTSHLSGAPAIIRALVLEGNAVAPVVQIVTGVIVAKFKNAPSATGEDGVTTNNSGSSGIHPTQPHPHSSSENLIECDHDHDHDHHHVHFDAEPLEGSQQVFPIVQNEGLVALLLMANACGEPGVRVITRFAGSLVPMLLRILKSGVAFEDGEKIEKSGEEGEEKEEDGKVVYPDAVKVNVCLLLGVLASTDGKCQWLFFILEMDVCVLIYF